MVVIGQYPYQHTITLENLHRSIGKCYIYYVDDDKIYEVKDLPPNITVDHEHYIAYGEQTGNAIEAYYSQIIPPPSPVIRTKYDKEIEKVQDAALCLVINNQSSSIMENIGATWNNHLGTWIVAAEHLQTLRDRRRRKHDGKVYKVPYVDSTFKIYGDLTPHIEKLKAINAIYNEENDEWIVKASDLHKIASIWSK